MAIDKITADGIADNAIGTSKIGADVIVAEDIAANAITVSEIQDNAVTHAKLHTDMDLSGKTVTLPSLTSLGIGTASPGKKLHIKDSTPDIRLEDTDTNAVVDLQGNTGTGSFVLNADVNDAIANSKIVFKVDNDEKVRIDNNGKLGIKEDSPSCDLVVKQSGSTFTTASQTVALFQRNSTTGHGCKVTILSGNNTSGDLNFGDAEDEDIGKISYEHNNNAMKFTTNTAEAMTINSSGNVGLGATALSLNAPNLLTIRNSSNGNEADVMLGNQTIRRGYVGINSSETRYFKCISYSNGNMFTGDVKMFVNRGGGFNQTQAFRHYNCSIGGYNNGLYGFATDAGDSGTGGVATIHLGSDEGIYIKVANNLYGGDVFFTFEGSGTMAWVFNIGTYVTSAP
tara:strand:+ start:529 stop:1722 length:1194 start_codon:yes stop_codon:yes gene_type:complete